MKIFDRFFAIFGYHTFFQIFSLEWSTQKNMENHRKNKKENFFSVNLDLNKQLTVRISHVTRLTVSLSKQQIRIFKGMAENYIRITWVSQLLVSEEFKWIDMSKMRSIRDSNQTISKNLLIFSEFLIDLIWAWNIVSCVFFSISNISFNV